MASRTCVRQTDELCLPRPRLARVSCLLATAGGRNQVTAARVLLVEDEVLIRLVAAELLRDEGFEVVEAWDGDEARGLIDGLDGFDVLFTDVQMPGKFDGIDVALYARRRHPVIPILVVSGYAAHLMTRLGVLDPAAVFMSKPYSLMEVLAVLNRLTGIG